MPRLAIVAPLLLLAACNAHRNDPGAVSAEEDRMLNAAAASQEASNAVIADNAANAAMTNTSIADQGNQQ